MRHNSPIADRKHLQSIVFFPKDLGKKSICAVDRPSRGRANRRTVFVLC